MYQGSENSINREELLKLEKEELLDILLAKIAALEARLNQNSKNSSRPPSSDTYNRPQSPRKPSGKKAGGQPGHEGNGFTMLGASDCYLYLQHTSAKCAGCPQAMGCKAKKVTNETRYEVDIEITTKTTAHQTLCVKCPLSAEVLIGRFPDHITGTMQYGINIEALAVSLNTMGMVSINRTHELLNSVFNVPISTGTIAGMVSGCAQKVASCVAEIKEAVIASPLIHIDETGLRIDKKTAWAHVASTDKLTYITVGENRGQKGIEAAGVLPAYTGIAIHDCWAPYFQYSYVTHGLCNAHLLRELLGVAENTQQAWAQKLIGLLVRMKKTKEKLIAQNHHEPPPYFLKKYAASFDAITQEALAHNPVHVPDGTPKGRPKRGKVRALIDRLILHKDKWLLFFTDFNVPFDNNQAERDIRMLKVKQKVSGCFRTMNGAQHFTSIMSYIGTARKQGLSAYKAIQNALWGKPFSVLCVDATE